MAAAACWHRQSSVAALKRKQYLQHQRQRGAVAAVSIGAAARRRKAKAWRWLSWRLAQQSVSSGGGAISGSGAIWLHMARLSSLS